MKIIILTIFCICINMNMYAQKYFSKMFDVNKSWESFVFPINTTNNHLILSGTSINFFVNDSTRFRSVILVKLDSTFNIIAKMELREPFKNYTYLIPIKNLNNKFVYGLLDTNNRVSYKILKLNDINIEGFKSINFPYSISLTNNDILTINNKLYFFCADYTTFIASKLKLSIQCMDTNGNLLWGKIFQDKRCYTNNVVQTKDGNFLLAGYKYYGEGSGGDDSAFAWYAKVDTLGNILWEQVLNRGSELMCSYVYGTNANGNIYLTGSNIANYPFYWYKGIYGDTSFSYMLKINENNGKIEWQKRFLYTVNNIRGLNDNLGEITYHNSNLYALIDHHVSERENPQDFSQYVMFAKFDLQGNLIWKRLFSNWYLSNRAYSLTPIDDGFLICGDSKDSTHAKGDSDAWLIKTDSNGCIIPNCNAKDGIVQIINPEKVFTVYPNPAQNEINVSTENLDIKIESLAVYNLQGQVLKFRQAQLPEKEITKINTEDLANGNYLLIITTNKQQMAGKKFVVER